MWRLPVRIRAAGARAAATVIIVVMGLAIYFGATGSRLHRLPDREEIIDVFFRTVFVPIIVLLIAWYIATLKLVRARAREYVFLNSLPLSSSDIHRLFLVSGVCRFPWVPFCMVVLLSALAVVAPASFLIRLIVLALVVYVLLQTAGITLHLAVSLRRADRNTAKFPAVNSPLIQLVVVMAYAAMLVIWILYPGQITVGYFWIVVVACALITIALFAVSKRCFEKWHGTNVILRAMDTRDSNPRMGYKTWARVLNIALVPLKSNPLVIKNLVRYTREASLISRLILALCFIAMSFLVARNNESIQDVVTVLSGMFYLYVFFFVTKEMGRLDADEESPALIYSMPVTRAQLYLSVFAPTIGWLATIALAQSILVILAGGGVVLAARFLLMSLFVALVFCGIGVSAAVSGYPNRRDALKRFLISMLVLAVSVVVLYKFRLFAMVAVASTSLLLPSRKRLYKT